MSESAVELTSNPVVTEIQVTPVEVKKNILDLFKSQDFNQKVGVIPTVLFELYKVMVSSFLILFVPQNCDGHVCTLSENLVTEDNLYTSGLVINFITMFSFLIFYLFEILRENKLITYLEVNTTVPADNESVGKSLELLPEDKKLTIW